jgi:hypothetical protein
MENKIKLFLLFLSGVFLIAGCGSGEMAALSGEDEWPSSEMIVACEKGWLESAYPLDGAIDVPLDAKITLFARDGIDLSKLDDKDMSVRMQDIAEYGGAEIAEDNGVDRNIAKEVIGEIGFSSNDELEFAPTVPMFSNANVMVAVNYEPCRGFGKTLFVFYFKTKNMEVFEDAREDVREEREELVDSVAPAGIGVSLKEGTRATLTWVATGDDAEAGTAAYYELRYSSFPITDEAAFDAASAVAGLPVPAVAGTIEEFVVPGLDFGRYYFSLRAYDEAGNASPVLQKRIDIKARVTKLAEAEEQRIKNDYMARSIAGGCDFNGDGLSDLLIGASNDDTPGVDVGRAFVVLGKQVGDLGLPGEDGINVPDVTIDGIDSHVSSANDYFGMSVSCGDFNGDGFSDMAIGAPNEDTSNGVEYVLDSGAVYLFLGGEDVVSGLTLSASEADIVFRGTTTRYYFGYSVSFVGDLNDDGMDELATVAPSARMLVAGDSAVYIFHGNDNQRGSIGDFAAEVKIRGEVPGSGLQKVDGGGDLDGDGKIDLVLSTAQYPNNTNMGRIYVLLGKNGYRPAMDVAIDSEIILTGANAGEFLGGMIAQEPAYSIRGDLNGDGKDDLVVAAPYATGSVTMQGRVYVFYGRVDWSGVSGLEDADVVITGNLQGDRFGSDLDSGMDLNNDGRDDLLISSPYFDNGPTTDLGGVFVFYGVDEWPEAMNASDADVIISSADGIAEDIAITPAKNGDTFGAVAAFAGDMDGDDYVDILIGSLRADMDAIVDCGAIFIVR